MAPPNGLTFGLGSLPLITDAETRSISAENPDGARGGGAKADPKGKGAARELGPGWKVRPCITLKAGKTVTLADIQGPGVIRHVWITVRPEALRSCVLRFFWDGSRNPSIEVPLGDFFALGHGRRTKVVSLPVAVCPTGGMNCYWPMPFAKRAKVTVENGWHEDISGFFYQIDYATTDVPAEAGYLHAQWRRSLTTREVPEHVILDGVKGRGHYVGTYLAWTQLSAGWWGEGEVKFFIDGDSKHPTYCGTGTEDYFGGAWGFHDAEGREQCFNTPFLGLTLSVRDQGGPPQHGLYRWHVMDPVHFREDLKVTIQALGWWPGSKYQPLTDDIASVAYWYQTLPPAKFPKLPDMNERYPR
jgi:hypothetical protein